MGAGKGQTKRASSAVSGRIYVKKCYMCGLPIDRFNYEGVHTDEAGMEAHLRCSQLPHMVAREREAIRKQEEQELKA
jgi:hypothetical protein